MIWTVCVHLIPAKISSVMSRYQYHIYVAWNVSIWLPVFTGLWILWAQLSVWGSLSWTWVSICWWGRNYILIHANIHFNCLFYKSTVRQYTMNMGSQERSLKQHIQVGGPCRYSWSCRSFLIISLTIGEIINCSHGFVLKLKKQGA